MNIRQSTKDDLSQLAAQYLEAMLGAKRHLATQLVLGAVDQGTEVRDIYLQVFQPCQRELGRLWQTNQISVAQEHYCTAATQHIISMLYPHIFGAPRIDRKLLMTCVGGELHELGARMVADFFEMAGWDTHYLGANTPSRSILQTIEEQNPDMLGLSVTISYNLGMAADLIEEVQASVVGRQIPILVGGRLFNTVSDLWQNLHADGYAADANQALSVAGQLIG